MNPPPTTFLEAAEITPVGSHEYKANIHPDFSFGTGGHGGFMVALCWRAVTEHFRTTLAKYALPDTVSFHAEFLRPGALGEARLHIKDTRLGKGSSTVHVSMVQSGREKVVAYASNVNRSKSKGVTNSTGYGLQPPPSPINFEDLLAGKDPNWIKYQVSWQSYASNRALSNLVHAVPRKSNPDKYLREQWITPAIPGVWTTDKLGLVCDSYVPPLENIFPSSPHSAEATAAKALDWSKNGPPKIHPEWIAPRYYPTLNMSIEVKKALPPEGVKWLFVRVRTKDIREGRFDALCEVWDEAGDLVALSQQVWMVVEIDIEAFKQAKKRRGPGPSGKL